MIHTQTVPKAHSQSEILLDECWWFYTSTACDACDKFHVWGHTEVALMEAICALTMLMLLLLTYPLNASHFTGHCAGCHFLSTGFSIQSPQYMVDKDDWWVGFDDADADKDDGDADKGNDDAKKTMLKKDGA